MLKRSTLISICLLSGCAAIETPATVVPELSSGGGHKISCGGMNRDWTACYQQASDLCGDPGYSVLSRSEDSSPIFFLARSGMVHREFFVECRQPKSTPRGRYHAEAFAWQGS